MVVGRTRSVLPILNGVLRSDSALFSQRSAAVLRSAFFTSELPRNYASAPPRKMDDQVKVPLVLFGGSGNYASALFLAAKKASVLDKVESEILDLIEASKGSPTFSQFMKDLSVPSETRVKAINDVCATAKFSDITKNFLALLAENGRLREIETIAKKFVELTMAEKGEVRAIVTTVIPLPEQEEKELKETLQDIMGGGKKIKLEQKIDPSILGGIMVEFAEKVFDMSIKTRALQMERFLREPISIGSL